MLCILFNMYCTDSGDLANKTTSSARRSINKLTSWSENEFWIHFSSWAICFELNR